MHSKHTRSRSLDPLRERALVIAAQASQRAWAEAPHRRWRCAAWEELFLRHERTIWKQVRAFAPGAARHGIEMDDLHAEFCAAFFRTVVQFDYARSTRIATSFVWEAKRQYLDAVRSFNLRGLRIPSNVSEYLAAIRRAERLHYRQHGSSPTNEQLATATGLAIAHVVQWRTWRGGYTSLDARIRHDSSVTLHDVLADQESEDPSDIDDDRTFAAAFATLPPRDQVVLKARYLEEEERTLQEVGARIAVSAERVRVLVNRARERLRRAILYQRHPGRPTPGTGRTATQPAHP